MNCSQVKEKIPQWLDGELEPADSGIIAAHVKGCADCRGEADFWRKLGTVLREDLEDIKAPPGFTNQVMAQLAGHQRTGLGRLIYGWKRNLAVAATFMLVAAGSVGVYLQMDGDINKQMLASGESNRGEQVNITEPGSEPKPNSNIDTTDISANKPNVRDDREGSGSDNQSGSGGQGANGSGSNDAGQEPAVSSNHQTGPSRTVEDDPKPTVIDSAGQYTLLNTAQDRFVESTLVRVKVEDMNTAHGQALSIVNNSGAHYEVLGSESTPNGGQETLKIMINNDLSGWLQGELKKLGQVITTETQRDDLSSRYNEKVELYRSLESQLQAAQTEEETYQLQAKMAGIEEQLKAWNREANTSTIILWLEN